MSVNPDPRAIVAATLLEVIEWIDLSNTYAIEADLRDGAAKVLATKPDSVICGFCQEVVCDDGCPLDGFRDAL